MDCREKLKAYLRSRGVAFEEQEHRPAYTAQEVAAAEHVPGRSLAKVVMVFGDDRLVMLVVPASHRVDLDRAAAALEAEKVRLAKEQEFAGYFPDCEPGAMPPFGKLYGVPVYVDRSLGESETVVFQAGSHTHTMSLRYADFARLVAPSVSEFAYQPGRAAVG